MSRPSTRATVGTVGLESEWTMTETAMRSTRIGSSYKEEVLRHLHAQPNGVFADDRLGVTVTLSELLQSKGLPVSVATVSSALNSLSKDGRVEITYGHRSLDNKLLVTKVVVHSEPHPGVALPPREPLEPRGPLPHEVSNDPVFVMLRRLVRLMENQPSLSTQEIERFQLHVDHLVEENQTWEALAQEIENGSAETIDDLHRQLDESEARHQDEVRRLTTQSANLRERAERYRMSLVETRSELSEEIAALTAANHELTTDNDELRRQRDELQHRTDVLASSDRIHRRSADRIRSAMKESNRIHRLREDRLLVDELFPIITFVQTSLAILYTVTNLKGSAVVGASPLIELGMVDRGGEATETSRFTVTNLTRALELIGRENGAARPKGFSLTTTKRSVFVEFVRAQLDESIGVPPAIPEPLDDEEDVGE